MLWERVPNINSGMLFVLISYYICFVSMKRSVICITLLLLSIHLNYKYVIKDRNIDYLDSNIKNN
jgi:hypothetical protein